MEHHKDRTDLSDELIREILQEQFGPPPGRELWQRIAQEVAAPPSRPIWRELLAQLQQPLFHSVMVVAMLALLIVQPAFYWMHQEYPSPAPVKIAVPNTLKQQPLADGDPRFMKRPAVTYTVRRAPSRVPVATPIALVQAQ